MGRRERRHAIRHNPLRSTTLDGMHAHAMKEPAEVPRRLLACLSDSSRFRIVCLLVGDERCVTEIARVVGLSQSCTTRHLQALARDRIVRRRRDGKRVLFRLDDRDPSVRGLLAWAGVGAPDQPAGRGLPGRSPAELDREGPGGVPRASTRGPSHGTPAVGSATSGAGPSDRGQPDPGPAQESAEPAGTPDSDETERPDQETQRGPAVRPGDLEDYLL
jgi:DNA-binding transcriptional ArsR family regulator